MAFRVVQVSDTHLSATRAYGVANFDVLAAAIAQDRPDLVVATGDLALDDPSDDADRSFARDCFSRLAVPWRALPGNHDIGDDGPEPWMGEPVSTAWRDAWVAAWGPDWWAEEAGEWVLVGLDSLLFASGLPAEQEQWSWLAGALEHAGTRPVMVFVHKPLWVWWPDEPADQKTVTEAGRRLLRNALRDAHVRVVASGHLHQFRASVHDGQVMVWAPSTCFISPGPSPYGANKTVGAVEYCFEGETVTWRLLRPPGMVDHDVEELAGGAESLRFGPPRPP